MLCSIDYRGPENNKVRIIVVLCFLSSIEVEGRSICTVGEFSASF